MAKSLTKLFGSQNLMSLFVYASLKVLKILFAPGFVFIRNDFIEQADYKKFSIREIM
jgi:hypothetical protein